jgi:hypothetical protein
VVAKWEGELLPPKQADELALQLDTAPEPAHA